MSKRDNVKEIIIKDSCGWHSSNELLEKVTDIICDKLQYISNDYEELVNAYVRL